MLLTVASDRSITACKAFKQNQSSNAETGKTKAELTSFTCSKNGVGLTEKGGGLLTDEVTHRTPLDRLRNLCFASPYGMIPRDRMCRKSWIVR
jgi:hypothetical protein